MLHARPLQVRIGIHTGLVVVGEMGAGAAREQVALGETPNIAARVQGKAEPDCVVISAATQRLVQGLFECEDLGPQELKGITVPLALYRVVAESAARSHFEVAVRTGLTSLVGREPELELLHTRWEQAKTGAGQAVLLSGEPGIGKSRLVEEFKAHVIREGAMRMEFRCSPYHQNSTLYPVIQQLQRVLQFERADAPEVKLTKLETTLSQFRFPHADTGLLLATLLSLPHPESSTLLQMSPQRQKQKMQEVLVAWLVEEAERQPVYCAWEDVHWADPSTLELLGLVLAQVPTTRLLTLVVFRPEFIPPWETGTYMTQLSLTRLGQLHVEGMIEKVTHGRALPVEVTQQITAKTDGVPLFVEELTKMVVESGTVRAVNSHYELTGPLSSLAIPATLQDSLMARLDRLSVGKEVAQWGATLGREFNYELLQAVVPGGEEALQQGLQQLVEAELIYRREATPQAHYLFKHALIQDTAYQSLLKSKRREYHGTVAQILEEQFGETKETQPEVVAHHYTEAGLSEHAVPYWQQAGQKAIARSANVEAINHFTKGLELIQTLPDTPERAQQELTLQLALGGPLVATKGYTTLETRAAFSRARELCQQVGETPQLFTALSGLGAFYLVRAEYQTARELAEQCLGLAQDSKTPTLLMAAHLVQKQPTSLGIRFASSPAGGRGWR